MGKCNKNCLAGGQAVLEGVMMKSPNHVAVAVRKMNKKISIKKLDYNPLSGRYKFLNWPFIRGVITLYEMMKLGIKALTFSANESTDDEEEKLSGSAIFFTIVISLLFAVALFVVLPYGLTILFGFHEENSSLLFNLVDGLIKLIILLSYIVVIGKMNDIKRVFQYHGAEHKAVNCYEQCLKLTPKNCRKFTTINPRCGTSFLMFVIILGIILFSFVPLILIAIWPNMLDLGIVARKFIFLGARLLFLLPLISLSYEFLKLTAKFSETWFLRWLTYPGRWVQKLTTREPTDEQVEVAIKSLKYVLKKEGVKF